MTKKLLILVILLSPGIPAFSQGVDTAWVRRYNGPGNGDDRAVDVAVDDFGNSYVTGTSFGSETQDDLTTIRYYPNGDTAWVRRYNGPRNLEDVASAIAVDGSGNVHVTGVHDYRDYLPYTNDYATIKYDSNGNELWVRTYNGPGDSYDGASAIAIDGSGNVYVTGRSDDSVTMADYATIKYDSNGNELWVRRYNGPVNSADVAYGIAVDGSGNVYATGWSWGSGTEHDYATIKYDANGDTAWVRRYNGPGNDRDEALAVATDGFGNVCVTGYSYGSGTYHDYATIKYYPNGDTAWVRRYNGPGNGNDYPHAVAVDFSGNVCVTGGSYGGSGTRDDYATIKYCPNGDTAWVRRWNHPVSGWDQAYAIAVDDSGNVYVTGRSQSSGPGYNYDYITIKYDPNGNQLWIKSYNGLGNDDDTAWDIAVHDSGNVYVTGGSGGSGTGDDYATIKYVQFLLGDVNKDGVVDIADVMYLINYLFMSGSAPDPIQAGDVNRDGVVDIADVMYLINYLFIGGSPPCEP